MPMRSRIGPLKTPTGVAPIVVARTPWMLKVSVQAISTRVMIEGRYSGFAPAMTALMAIFSTVIGARLGGITATSSCGSRVVPWSIFQTRSRVGGTTGKPSV